MQLKLVRCYTRVVLTEELKQRLQPLLGYRLTSEGLRHDTALGLNVLDDLHRRAVIHLGDCVRVDRFEVE
jgi:hypothetical protein